MSAWSGPVDPDWIAAQLAPEGPRDAAVRRAALVARQERSQARQAAEAADIDAIMLAERLALGRATVEDVVAALRQRLELRLQVSRRGISRSARSMGTRRSRVVADRWPR